MPKNSGTRRWDMPSRDRDEYETTDHYYESLEDPMRFHTDDMVWETVERGRDRPDEGGPDKMRRRLEYDGIDCVVVIALDHPVVVTAWTDLNDHVTAASSGRWSTSQLQTIQAFEDRLHKQQRQ